MSEINFVGFDPKNNHYNGEYILYNGIISYYDTRCDKPLGLISNKEINLSLKNPSSTLNHTVYLYHPDNFDYWCLVFKGNNGDPRYFNPYLNQKKEAKWILKFKIRNITRKKYYSDHVVSQSALKSYHQTRFPKVTIPYNDIYSIANAMIDGEIKGNTCNRELNGVLEQLCSLDLNSNYSSHSKTNSKIRKLRHSNTNSLYKVTSSTSLHKTEDYEDFENSHMIGENLSNWMLIPISNYHNRLVKSFNLNKIVNVNPDGTCLFHAIAYLINRDEIRNIYIDGHILRQQTADYIKKNFTSELLFQKNLIKEGETIDNYVNNLRKNKWGDYFEIFTLSNYLRLNIQIIKIDRNTYKFMNSIIIPYEDSNKTYTLLLIDDFHYMAVI